MAEQFRKRNIIIVAGIIVLIVLANIIGSNKQTASEQHLVESFFPAGQYILDKENDNKWVLYEGRIISNGFLKRAGNLNIREFAYDEPLDAVSGATVTSNAVIEAVRYSYLEGEELPYEDAACEGQTRPAIPAFMVPEMEMGTVVGRTGLCNLRMKVTVRYAQCR